MLPNIVILGTVLKKRLLGQAENSIHSNPLTTSFHPSILQATVERDRLSRIALAALVGTSLSLSGSNANDVGRKAPEAITAEASSAETQTPVFSPTPEVVGKSEVWERLVAPFAREALERRKVRELTDPEWSKRVDPKLNEGRVNLLLYGYGETYEPPLTQKALIGSQTIISFDTKTKKVDIISFTHDIRAPEIERYLREQGRRDAPVKIWRAYHDGGLPLMRQVLENASGLSIDFQVAVEDSIIADFINQVFREIEVEVPRAFKTEGFWYKGELFEGGSFEPGKEKMDGKRVLQFIKTVPLAQPEFGRDDYGQLQEHNYRKRLVFEAMIGSLKEKIDEPLFFMKLMGFLVKDKGEMLNFDFDPKRLLIRNLVDFLRAGAIIQEGGEELLPKFGEGVYVVDKRHGDGGVRWVKSEGVRNSHIQKEIGDGFYGKATKSGDPYAMAIPIGGDPYAEDLAEGYWFSVRDLVRESLLGSKPSSFCRSCLPISDSTLARMLGL